jgi:hypothetical protein
VNYFEDMDLDDGEDCCITCRAPINDGDYLSEGFCCKECMESAYMASVYPSGYFTLDRLRPLYIIPVSHTS